MIFLVMWSNGVIHPLIICNRVLFSVLRIRFLEGKNTALNMKNLEKFPFLYLKCSNFQDKCVQFWGLKTLVWFRIQFWNRFRNSACFFGYSWWHSHFNRWKYLHCPIIGICVYFLCKNIGCTHKEIDISDTCC